MLYSIVNFINVQFIFSPVFRICLLFYLPPNLKCAFFEIFFVLSFERHFPAFLKYLFVSLNVYIYILDYLD